MSIEKYLKRREIKKTIDPGSSSAPNTNTSIPKEVITNRDVSKTDLNQIAQDLKVHAAQVQTQIRQAIDDIVTANSSDAGFKQYHEMVKANWFDPAQLLKDPTARPSPQYSAAQVKAAERDVYRRVLDPRAPFVGDLYNMAAEAGVVQYLTDRIWDRFLKPNDLYTSFDSGERLTRLALFKEKQHLEQIKEQSTRIKKNKAYGVADHVVEAVSYRLMSQINVNSPKDAINWLNSTIGLLKQIKILLGIQMILNTENWEKFGSDIKDIFGDFVNYTSVRSSNAILYSLVGGVQNKVLDFTEDIENAIPLNIDLLDIPELREFRNQIDNVFHKVLAKTEGDFIQRESVNARLEESRKLQIANSKKNRKTKEFLEIMDKVIIILEETKANMGNLSTLTAMDVDFMSTKLRQKLATFANKVATKPYQNQPDLYPDGQQIIDNQKNIT